MAGDGRKYGRETNLKVGQFLVSVFDNQLRARLSDEMILKIVKKEFPFSDTDYGKYLSMYRNRYNRGEWSCQVEAPLVPIPVFDEKGNVVEKRPGPQPKQSWEE